MTRIYAVVVIIAFLFFAHEARATSLQEFQAKSVSEQSRFLSDYIDRLTGEANRTNPEVSRAIHDYFYVTPAGKASPEGLVDLTVQEMLVDKLVKQGKADKSKIQIEAMVNYIVKQRFPRG